MIYPYWMLAIASTLVMGVWPFRRGRTAEPAEGEPVAEDQAAEPVIDHVDWGIRLGMLGRFERAAERFQNAVDVDPGDASGHYNLALALDEGDDHQGACVSYQRAIEIDPDFAHAHCNLGIAQLRLGDSEAAVRSLARAAELDPSDPVPHFNLACIYLGQKCWNEGVAELSEAKGIDPKDPQVRFNLAIGLRKVGNLEDAERELRDFLVLARGRYPEHREFATRLLQDEYGEKGDQNAP